MKTRALAGGYKSVCFIELYQSHLKLATTGSNIYGQNIFAEEHIKLWYCLTYKQKQNIIINIFKFHCYPHYDSNAISKRIQTLNGHHQLTFISLFFLETKKHKKLFQKCFGTIELSLLTWSAA